MTYTDQLKAVIAGYLAADPVVLTTLSSRAFSESKLLPRFVAGTQSITLARADRALVWFSLHWPQGAAWPAGVTRPQPPTPVIDSVHSHSPVLPAAALATLEVQG